MKNRKLGVLITLTISLLMVGCTKTTEKETKNTEQSVSTREVTDYDKAQKEAEKITISEEKFALVGETKFLDNTEGVVRVEVTNNLPKSTALLVKMTSDGEKPVVLMNTVTVTGEGTDVAQFTEVPAGTYTITAEATGNPYATEEVLTKLGVNADNIEGEITSSTITIE